MRRLFIFLVLWAPAAAFAFEAIDTQVYPSTGRFPAYDATPEYPRGFWLQGGVMYDDNVLRRSDVTEDETVARLGAGVRADARVIGRQRVRLEANVDAYKFEKFSDLDHVAYGLLSEWLWEVGNRVSGTLGFTRRDYQASLAEVRAPVRDRITADRLYGSAAYRFAADWRVRGALSHERGERPSRPLDERESDTAAAGIDYVTPLGNAIGLEARASEGDAPLGEIIDPAERFLGNQFTSRELAVVGTYNTGPQLRLAGRVGYTEVEYSEVPERNFDGGTWTASVEWLPGNKTILALELYREPRVVLDIDASHVLVEGVAFGPSWAPSAKLAFSARVVRDTLEFQGDPATRDEQVRALRLGAGWEITRRLKAAAALDRGERSSGFVGRDYEYTALMANLRYDF